MKFNTEQEAWDYWVSLYDSLGETLQGLKPSASVFSDADVAMFNDWVDDNNIEIKFVYNPDIADWMLEENDKFFSKDNI